MKQRISLLLAASFLLSLLGGCQPPAAESEPPASAPAADIQCADVLTGIWRAGGGGILWLSSG